LRLTPDMADLISRDPITAAAWEHMRENQSLRAGEGFSVARYQVAGDVYQRPSVIMDLMIHRCLVEIFRAKKIAWDFVVLANDSFWDDFMWYFNKHKVGDVVSVGGRSYAIYAKDWRRLPLRQWMELRTSVELPDPIMKRGNGLDGGAGHTAVLSRSEFDKAVVDALESLHRRDRLARNPLTRTRMVAGHADDDPVASLRALLAEVLAGLREDPQAGKYSRAVDARFVRGAPTREAAADRLGLSLSTYGRHLAEGLKRIRDQLWERELQGDLVGR
jgi:hypothetical protein